MDFLTPQFVSSVGIPTVICLYTLFELNKSVKHLTDAINEFKDKIKERDEIQRIRFETIEHEIMELKYKIEVK